MDAQQNQPEEKLTEQLLETVESHVQGASCEENDLAQRLRKANLSIAPFKISPAASDLTIVNSLLRKPTKCLKDEATCAASREAEDMLE